MTRDHGARLGGSTPQPPAAAMARGGVSDTAADVNEQLTHLAAEINREHEAVRSALSSGLEHARTAGQLLLEARGLCPHGTWLPWLAEHFDGSERTARAYMQVAREWERLTEGNRQRVADLPYRTALRALAEPHINDASDSAKLEPEAAAPGRDGHHQVVPMSRAEAEAAVDEIRHHLAHVAPVVGNDAMQAWIDRVGQAGNRDEITAAFEALEAQLTPERVQSYFETCLALLEIRDRRGYHQAGYKTFESYCASRWGFTRDQVADAMALAEDVVAARAAPVSDGIEQ